MKLLQLAMLIAVGLTAMSHAGAQAPQPDTPSAMRGADPYLPPALRKPLRDASPGTALLRYQPMQKLKKRFDAADLDGSGTLSREEAHQAGPDRGGEKLRPHRHRPTRRGQLRRPENLPDPAPRRSAFALIVDPFMGNCIIGFKIECRKWYFNTIN